MASIEFTTALFPTTPEEHRVTAAWNAMRYNVEVSWVETCMKESGFEIEMPRVNAAQLRRNADLPDFELDAQMGLMWQQDAEDLSPVKPVGMSAAQDDAWDDKYTECSNDVEIRRSTQFDQLMGKVPFWWDIVREINDSSEMAKVTMEMLECIADNGGPQVDSVEGIYLAIDAMLMSADDVEDFNAVIDTIPPIIGDCAGNYSETRQALLLPERDEILLHYGEELTEAEGYFNEVVSASGWDH